MAAGALIPILFRTRLPKDPHHDQIRGRRRTALVGNVGHRHACRLSEQLAGKVRHGTGPRGGVVGLARIGLHPGQQRPGIAGRRARSGGQREIEGAHQRHRAEVLDRVIAQVLVKPGLDHQRPTGRKHQGLAIRSGPPELAQRDASAGAGLVVHDHVLTQGDPHLVSQQTRHDVHRATRREADQDAYGRFVLRQRQGRCQGGSSQQGEVTELSALHAKSPLFGVWRRLFTPLWCIGHPCLPLAFMKLTGHITIIKVMNNLYFC